MNEALPLSTSERKPVAIKTIAIASLLAGMLAAVANYVVYGVARLGGVDFVGRFDPQAPGPVPLPIVMIAVASLVPALFGGAIYAGLRALTARGRGIFVGLAAVVAVLSCASPMNLHDAGIGTKLALATMHLVAAAVVVATLLRRAP